MGDVVGEVLDKVAGEVPGEVLGAVCDEVVGVSLINLGCPLSCPKDIIDSRCISIDPRVCICTVLQIHPSIRPRLLLNGHLDNLAIHLIKSC